MLPAVPSTMVPPGCSAPRAIGVADDEQRGAVLDRLAGVHELGLAEDGAAGQLGGLAELDQRRVADGGDDVLLDIHGASDAPAGGFRQMPERGLGERVGSPTWTSNQGQFD